MVFPTPRAIGTILAALHLAGVLITAFSISASSDGQAPLLWALWAIIDFPWSLLYMPLGAPYSNWIESLSHSHPTVAMCLYLPYVLHGVVGTLWWYCLPTIVSRFVQNVFRTTRGGR